MIKHRTSFLYFLFYHKLFISILASILSLKIETCIRRTANDVKIIKQTSVTTKS